MKKKHTKKQKIIAIVALVAVAIALVLFIVIGIPMIKDYKNSGYNSKYVYDDVSLVGVWREKNFENNTYYVYNFKSNGSVDLSLSVQGMEAIIEKATYRVEDKNTLIVTYEGNDSVINNEETLFSISEDKTTLVLKDQNFLILEKYSSDYNHDNDIFGTWDGQIASFTFGEDYLGEINEIGVGNKILFSTKGNKMYIFIDENLLIEGYEFNEKFIIEYEYEIENDTLTLKGSDGKVSTYQRRK